MEGNESQKPKISRFKQREEKLAKAQQAARECLDVSFDIFVDAGNAARAIANLPEHLAAKEKVKSYYDLERRFSDLWDRLSDSIDVARRTIPKWESSYEQLLKGPFTLAGTTATTAHGLAHYLTERLGIIFLDSDFCPIPKDCRSVPLGKLDQSKIEEMVRHAMKNQPNLIHLVSSLIDLFPVTVVDFDRLRDALQLECGGVAGRLANSVRHSPPNLISDDTRKITAKEKAALDMRVEGETFQEIAQRLAIKKQSAYRLVKAAEKKLEMMNQPLRKKSVKARYSVKDHDQDRRQCSESDEVSADDMQQDS